MIDADALGRSACAILVITALGLLWPLRSIWAFPLAIILLGVITVMVL
jgi:hypothetical protein